MIIRYVTLFVCMIRLPPISTRTDPTLSLHAALPISCKKALAPWLQKLDDEKKAIAEAARKEAEEKIAAARVAAWRSEEHTSELQSLMRSSYAVFCWQTKKKTHTR